MSTKRSAKDQPSASEDSPNQGSTESVDTFQLPSEIIYGLAKYQVTASPTPFHGGEDGALLLGQVKPQEETICVWTGGTSYSTRKICLHEVIHAISIQTGGGELSEEQIENLAEGLLLIASQNPEFWASLVTP